ncbi:MAG: DNA mismatch repair protein MutS [Ignavibacteria bacterium]|jgi:DNA mismatch repair protein MutS|nr:DNA mismatch repair protein MutS [Ignavibacteria bacterium]MCU7498390.1 DNA mismatch repair protein MutS [Ignavibacteria bacterium]MCU7511932.1 DNA mismatch repair protein MutS [Ignavibacteria bacterium]MCU7520035.1 DNA mismatch repair protein MutS [Ignavibacteria bacterium]MCU7523109.1 DNA mismatch repair protein MutS [Ignavibacteria bacterium]
MSQYHKIKESHPDTILLFRVGDFFETFEEDAKIASKVLGITLTRRSNGASGDTPLAGFPFHALDAYLPKLVRSGYRVAVCEQIENPKFAKGIVKREVIEVVTPGVALSDKLLDHKRNNYLAALCLKDGMAGISFCDISTGEYFTYEVSADTILSQLELISPAEILIQKKDKEEVQRLTERWSQSVRFTKMDDWIFNFEYCRDNLLSHFKTVNLKGFGIDHLTSGIIAAGVILQYLQDTQKVNLTHLNKISRYNPSEFMMLDSATKRNLEITYTMNDGAREGSLISIMDKTETAMGGRMLKKWISAPLRKLEPVLQRQECIEEFVGNKALRNGLTSELKEVGDLERLISKVCTGKANPREIISLKNSLKKIPVIKEFLNQVTSPVLCKISSRLESLEKTVTLVEEAISEYPPLALNDGGVIAYGFNPELDELRDLSKNAKSWIANLQKSERERTGISSLKVSYNKVFGYYIEISNANLGKIPDDYIRKQTLVNGERYITPELKTYEDKILNAEEKIADLEYQLFNEIRQSVSLQAEAIQMNAQLIAMLDCYLSFAECAVQYNYVKPEVNESDIVDIKDGRHPVVERILRPGEKFTPNSYHLDNSETQVIVLTGPNMAGKSVYLRQLGLIVLLAQVGSFVPAREASIGLVDKIYTRVGASDNISAGESTFLVEMQEAANILNNATSKSLILLDEIGRGTSTFDGISIAWAITEYLHENPDLSAKTLFATHYHELNEMATIFPRIKNFKVEVREYGDKVIFLHKVSPGGADHSYGIQVAQMAGLPEFVTKRAKEILENLEGKELTPMEVKKARLAKMKAKDEMQLSFFEVKDDSIRQAISDLEIDNITPVEALNKLNELKKKVQGN